MSTEGSGVRADVHVLIEDLLPVLLPDARFDAATGEVVLPIGRAEPRASTATVVRRCAQAPHHRWPQLVDAWLREVSDQAVRAVSEIELLGDIRKLLRLRIVPKTAAGTRNGFVATPFTRHFDAVVVIDHPQYGGPLTKDRCARLGLSKPGRAAIRNTRELELLDLDVGEQPLTLTESVTVIGKPGSTYVSAALTELPRFLPWPCLHGALMGVPRHSAVLLYPVTSEAVADVIPVFAEVVSDMYEGSSDACSPGVFWWHENRLFALDDPAAAPGRPGGLPAELREVMGELPRADRRRDRPENGGPG